MLRSAAILPLVLLAISLVDAAPVVEIREPSPAITLPFVRNLNLTTHGNVNSRLIDADRARAAHILAEGYNRSQGSVGVAKGRNGTQSNATFTSSSTPESHTATVYDGPPPPDVLGWKGKRAASIPATNTAVTYVTTVGVGSPATQYTLLIDTGSSNTWVGAGKKYVKTKTSKSTGGSVQVSYGSGTFSGTEYTDTLTLSSSLSANSQSIGVASKSSGFSGVDGILGVGPADLTVGTVTMPDGSTPSIPTVPDTLRAQNKISSDILAVSYAPTTKASSTNGELSFGGVDSSKYTGKITYTPLTTTSPASYYWGVDQSITYGSSHTSILSSSAGIVDTGTTLLLLSTSAYTRYRKATGATPDSATGLLTISSANYAKLQSLYFKIGGATFELTANAQTWPRSLNSYIGGKSGSIYLVVGDLGSESGEGMDFINGYSFLERFYSVFDTSNKRFGLATTSNTKATTN